MTHTAISVAKSCGMIPQNDQVCIVSAYPPDKDRSARIEWEYAELPSEEAESEQFEPESANDDNVSCTAFVFISYSPAFGNTGSQM